MHTLHRMGVLSYQPQSEIPLLIFLQDRIREKYIYFDPAVYENRKQKATERLEAVRRYVTDNQTCRSQLLLSYFGETDSAPCGGCDVCLKIGRRSVPKDLFQRILSEIENLKESGSDDKTILNQLSKNYEENDIIDVMRWFTDNKKLNSKK